MPARNPESHPIMDIPTPGPKTLKTVLVIAIIIAAVALAIAGRI